MPTTFELARVNKFLTARLRGDSTLTGLVPGGIHQDVIPEKRPYPALVFFESGSTDVYGISSARILTRSLYTVRATTTGQKITPLVAIMDRVDVLLNGYSGAQDDVYIHEIVRDSTLSYSELDQGTSFRHLGSVWAIVVASP